MFIEINIDNNQAILVLSHIDYRKSFISVCDSKSSSYTLCNNRNLNVYTNNEMKKAQVRLVQQKYQRLRRDKYSKNIKGLGGVRTAFLSKLPCYFQ